MQAGLLTETITIQRVSEPNNTPYGGEVETWADYKTIKARKLLRGGSLGINAAEYYQAETVIFETHYHQDIKRSDRIKHGDDLYRVVSVDRVRRTRRVSITAERINE